MCSLTTAVGDMHILDCIKTQMLSLKFK